MKRSLRRSRCGAASRAERRCPPARHETHLHAGQGRLPARRRAVPDHRLRNAPGAHPGRVLGAPHPDGEGDGLQHHRARTSSGTTTRRPKASSTSRPATATSRGSSRLAQAEGLWVLLRPGPLRLRRMGLRRHPDLPAADPGPQGPLHEPAVHAGRRALHPAPRRGGAAPAGHQRRPHPDGADRERVRQLRQRPRLHGPAQGGLGDGRHRRARSSPPTARRRTCSKPGTSRARPSASTRAPTRSTGNWRARSSPACRCSRPRPIPAG